MLYFAARHFTLLGLAIAGLAPLVFSQTIDSKLYSEMHWREIGPPRAGRARALAGCQANRMSSI